MSDAHGSESTGIASVLAPAARQNDKEGRFSSEAVDALGRAGLLGLMLPTEFGGSGLGPRSFAAVTAALGSTLRTASRTASRPVTRSDGVGAECASVYARPFWNATLPTVRDCVTDFETAKSRRGVQACPQPDRTQDDSKLLKTIQ